jgi:hypothetical protein
VRVLPFARRCGAKRSRKTLGGSCRVQVGAAALSFASQNSFPEHTGAHQTAITTEQLLKQSKSLSNHNFEKCFDLSRMPTGWKAWQMANAPPAEVVAAAELAQSKTIKYKPRPVQQGGLNLIQAHRVQAPLLQVQLNAAHEVYARLHYAAYKRQHLVYHMIFERDDYWH